MMARNDAKCVQNEHWNKREDRRWRLKCCRAPGYETTQCKKTGKINKIHGWMDYKASNKEEDGVFVGLHSLHHVNK